VWDVVARYLRDRRIVPPVTLHLPRLINVGRDPGIA